MVESRRVTKLSAVDRFVRAPIGFLWLFVLAVVALPVMVYMTLLYYAARGAASLLGGRRARSPSRADPEPTIRGGWG